MRHEGLGGGLNTKDGMTDRPTDRPSGVPRNFVWGGVQQIQLRTEDRENGDLGT